MKKTIFFTFFLFPLVAPASVTCDVKALEKRLATYKEITEEVTKDLKARMAKIGCTDSASENCDHDVMRKIYIEHMESYNKTMNGIIAIENQDYGCPKELIDSLNKKEGK